MRIILILLLAVAGCRSLPGPTPTLLPEDEAAWVARIELSMAERSPGTPDLIGEFLAAHPDSLDARRYVQLLRIARGEAWQVYEEAKAAFEAAPDDPDLIYLHARTIPDREIQRDLFRRAVELDPSHFHANLGLAVVALDRRDGDDAARWAMRSFFIRSDSVRANLLYARALAAGGRRDEAHAILAVLIRDEPSDPSVTSTFVDLALQEGKEVEAFERLVACLSLCGSHPDLLRRLRTLVATGSTPDGDLEALSGVVSGRADAWRLRAAIRLVRGDAAEGLAILDDAVAAGMGALSLRNERLTAALFSGEYGRALECWEEGLAPLSTIVGEDRRAEAVASLRTALSAARGEDPSSLAALARALSSNGFAAEASHVANRAVALEPGHEEWQALAAETVAWENFLGDIRDAVRRSYWREKTRQPRPDLDEFLARLATASLRRLGRDVISDIPVDKWPFVGSIARTDFDGAPEAWADHGVFFVIGQREGGPVQGTMMRIVGHWPGQMVDGEAYELLVGDGRLFRTYFEFDGGNIAGFAMPGRVVLDLESLGRSEEAIRHQAARTSDRPLWPALDEERRRSLWFPNGIRTRLAAAYVAGSDAGDGSFETALRHEEGHVLDGARYTPISHHIPELFYQALRHGFSPSSIEVTLEANAETHTLKTTAYPRAALFGTTSFLPWERGAPPHSLAYHGLLRAIVMEIDEHPDRYSSIDRGYNILQQLDRLTDAELRRALDEALE